MPDPSQPEAACLPPVQWERMFPDQLEAAIARRPVLYFAYGLCEPHGPHNALGLDTLKAHALCCRAAKAHGGIVAPPDYWHVHEVAAYASWGHEHVGNARPWLTAVPPWVHFKNVCYHLRAADALGFHAALAVTGHYGPNWRDLNRLIDLLQPHFAMRLRGLPDFEANTNGFDGDGSTTSDHAGKVETSQLAALEPECVDMSRLPPADAPSPHFGMGATAADSDVGVGQRMVDEQVAWLNHEADRLIAGYREQAPAKRQPLSFADVERIWNETVAPVLPEFESMQALGRTPPPADSPWRLNYEVDY